MNGGQLCLYLFDDDGQVVRGVSNLEYLSHEDYRASVMAVHNGEDDMSDWDSQIEDPQADYDAAMAYRDLGARIIADRDGIYPESMNAAGMLAYGIDADKYAAPFGDEEYADLAREWGIVK